MTKQSKPSRLQLWIGLTRLHTLPTGLSSVVVAIAYAMSLGMTSWWRAILLGVIAISAQIGSNIANDLVDYRKGADTAERKGPLRPLSRGLMTEREVCLALAISLATLLIAGIALMAATTWWLSLVGLAVVLGLFAYSTGPLPLSYVGLGDLAVLVFFGWVPVVTSGYVLGIDLTNNTLWHLATSIGLASINVLIVNNYRDVEEDRLSGKRTLIVRFGREFGHRLYLSCGLLSIILLYPIYNAVGLLLVLPYTALMLKGYRDLRQCQGTELNDTLRHTARNVLLLAVLICLMLLCQHV